MAANNSTSNNLPADPNLAGKIVDAQAAHEKTKLDRGLVGWIFGTKDHVANNVAGLVVLIGVIFIFYKMAMATEFDSIKDQVVWVGGLVTTALGYLFGRSSR